MAPPRFCWLRPEDHLCSMSPAKVKKLTTAMKSKGKASSGKSNKGAASKFTGKSLYKKRSMFREMKQAAGESVTRWHNRIKEIAPLCKFGDDSEKEMKNRFIEGMKAGPVRDGVQDFSDSMEKLLDLAKNLERTHNEQASGSDFESTSDEDNDDADFEKDKSNYREVHAYDCPCKFCDIIRCNKSKKRYDPSNSRPEKLILVPKWL